MAVLDGDAVEAPLSVYFDIPKGDAADLEVIAEAAIAWSGALKKLFASIEPGAEIKVQLVDGDEGSLWLNTLLKFIESRFEQIAKGAERYPRIMALARGLAIIVVATPLQVTAENIWNAVSGDDPEIARLSPESQRQIKAIFEQVIAEKVAETESERFAAATNKDPRILGVGVSSSPAKRPSIIVSRADTQAYLDRDKSVNETEETRKRAVTMEVLLVSPVLEDAERSWKFRQPGMPEFGAVMKDRGFLDAIARQEVHEELRFGIPMRIEVEFKERFDGGIWQPEERNVIRVIRPAVNRSELPF